MSGGRYNYAYQRIEEFIDHLEALPKEMNTPKRMAFAHHLKKVAHAMKAIEWVDSCDWNDKDEEAAIRAVFGE